MVAIRAIMGCSGSSLIKAFNVIEKCDPGYNMAILKSSASGNDIPEMTSHRPCSSDGVVICTLKIIHPGMIVLSFLPIFAIISVY